MHNENISYQPSGFFSMARRYFSDKAVKDLYSWDRNIRHRGIDTLTERSDASSICDLIRVAEGGGIKGHFCGFDCRDQIYALEKLAEVAVSKKDQQVADYVLRYFKEDRQLIGGCEGQEFKVGFPNAKAGLGKALPYLLYVYEEHRILSPDSGYNQYIHKRVDAILEKLKQFKSES